MPLDVSNFITPENKQEGLYRLADTVKEQSDKQDAVARQAEGRKSATSKFLADYLDPKDHLTGTAYDPQIVTGFQDVLQEGQKLAAQGASTPDIMMALGPKVSRLNEYSTKAKLINQNIKESISKLKGYAGYNPEALETEAKRAAFYGPDGKLKDITTVDPETNWVTEVAKNNPEAITTSKGLDDFVNKTPMADYSRNVTTTYAGRSRNVKYEAKHPFWEDLQRDQNGNVAVDQQGNPVGLGVVGSPIVGDDNKPMINPETGQPYQALDKGYFNAIMQHNPDIADYIRGQVNTHFRAAGVKQLPAEGSPQWDAMARSVLHDELERRKRSTFRTVDQQKETAPAIKVDIGGDPEMLKKLQKYEEATKLKGDYYIETPKSGKQVKTNALESIGNIFNNDPDYLEGEQKDVNGRNVIDVTPYFPGGGLKSGRSEGEIFKSIYYDPTKRALLVEKQSKTKDASGNKPVTLEEWPENRIGIFMNRIAGANGIDPNKVSGLLDKMGYKGAKFTQAGNPTAASDRINEEHQNKIDTALKSDNFGDLKGIGTPDGTIKDVDVRTVTTFFGRDKYALTVETPDGKTKKVTFPDKEKLSAYLKQNSSGNTEDLRKKYNY